MKKITQAQRRVNNLHPAQFASWRKPDGSASGESVLQLNDNPLATGFHVYKMKPGARSQSHEHTGDEEFSTLSGELIDNDGTVYKEGDLVWLQKGTQHYSYTETGCLLAVYIPTAEKILDSE